MADYPEQLGGPPDPNAPTEQPQGPGLADILVGGISTLAAGFSPANYFALQENQRRQQFAELQSRQEGFKQVQQLVDLLKLPQRDRKLATSLAVKQGSLPQGYGELISKADDEQAQVFGDALAKLASENPNLNIDLVKQVLTSLPPHEAAIQLAQTAQQLAADKKEALTRELFYGGQQQQQPQAAPQQQSGGDPYAAPIVELTARLNEYNQRRTLLPAGSKMAAEAGKVIDDLRAQIGSLQAQQREARAAREEIAREQRHQEDKALQRENMARMASQFAQSLSAREESQSRIDARQERYLRAFLEKPLDASTQKDIAALESIARQIDNVETTYKKDYLGPVRGTDQAFSARRMAGGLVGAGVSEGETIFRESLADTADQLLRARSGAQINETEYKRLKNMLPKATDEEPVFKAGMKRFKKEVGAILESRVKLGTSSRRQVLESGGSPGKNDRGDPLGLR